MTHLLILLLSLHVSLALYGRAQQTLFPAAIPLAVRSPYLSSWHFTTNGTAIGKLWSSTSVSINGRLSMPVHVRVDNLTYSFLGGSLIVNGTANLTDMVITPTQTKLTAVAGPMQFNLTFLNPIEPGDWVKQSIPFSYLSLTAASLDGAAHAVQVYSEVSGEWLSGDRSQAITWNTTTNDNVIYHTAILNTPAVFNEINTQAEWGTLYYAMGSGDKVTYQTGQDRDTRGSFLLDGALDNQKDTKFRAINPNDPTGNPVVAISRDLGTIQATQDPVVWTVGFTTDPAIQYKDPSTDTPQRRSLYYKVDYSDDTSLILNFLNDFANASSRAQQLDSKILQDAAAVSGALGDLVSLATAQVYGSIQLTIGLDASGNFDKSDVMAFMKNIGGLSTNRVNAVATLYSAFPALMSIDPALGGLLLKPLFQLQASPSYTKPYAAANIGSKYPNVTISNSDHDQGVEQSGNMLIMTYAQARASGDGGLISNYYFLLTTWADYLSNSTLLIHDQSSADGPTSSNQTNLAIKGIIAIKAMSEMSSVVNRKADADKYSNTAASLYSQWKGLALASDQHLLAAYGLADSWALGYNLFADVWLNTSVVESSVYEGQSNFIDNVALASTFSNYGMPVDSNSTDIASSSWTLFTAAMTSNQDLRANLISRVHSRASWNISAGVFPVLYDSTKGQLYRGGASPAQGAMYAPLALQAPVLQITAGPVRTERPPRSRSKSHAGAIAGGVIAALLAIGAIALVAWRRRRPIRRRKSKWSSFERDAMEPDMRLPMIVTPFDPTLTEETEPEADPQTNWHWQHPWAEPVEPEIVPFFQASTSSYSPAPSPNVLPVPVGLSDKELARLREENSRSQSTVALPLELPSDPPVAATAGQDVVASTSEARRLQSEVESLRREMQQLAERFEAPPGYEDGDA